MKRFYKEAEAVPEASGWAILLDGRAVKTPERAPLAVPGAALAQAIVAEWAGQGDAIDPRTMPMCGFANATIDRILPAPGDFRGQIAAYAASDLFCYRAEAPAPLVARQAQIWDPLLGWARTRYDVAFLLAEGIMPVDQPAATLARLRGAVEALDPWLLAGVSVMTQIGGSLVGTLAHLEGQIGAEALFDAVTLDERWQAEQWGEDEQAAVHMAGRRVDFLNGARWCALVGVAA